MSKILDHWSRNCILFEYDLIFFKRKKKLCKTYLKNLFKIEKFQKIPNLFKKRHQLKIYHSSINNDFFFNRGSLNSSRKVFFNAFFYLGFLSTEPFFLIK